MFDMQYFRAIHGARDSLSSQETLRREIRSERTRDFQTSIGYVPDALRNGVIQPVVATATSTPYKYTVLAMPEEELCVGDILEFYGEHWILIDVHSVDVVTLIGTVRQCNHLFRWQNATGTIIERWGVLDAGSYSTSVQDEDELTILDKRYKIYLPKDEETEKLYIDKRIATEVSYDKNGKQILVVYQITGRDGISSSYGEGGHLLMLNAHSSGDYDPTRDNLELMICDYFEPSEPVVPDEETGAYCTISGRAELRAGFGSRNYVASFVDGNGSVVEGIAPVWDVAVPEDYAGMVAFAVNDGVLSLTAYDDAVGATITVTARDADGAYAPAVFEVKVVTAL